MNELESLKQHIRQLEQDLESIDKNLITPIKEKIEINKAKIHEIITPKLGTL